MVCFTGGVFKIIAGEMYYRSADFSPMALIAGGCQV
jgi:hypothetical protein